MPSATGIGAQREDVSRTQGGKEADRPSPPLTLAPRKGREPVHSEKKLRRGEDGEGDDSGGEGDDGVVTVERTQTICLALAPR